MNLIGKVESLWRYPGKSMRGEQPAEAFVGFSGVYGDRMYAFQDTGAPVAFPYLTGREQEQMILFEPVFRHPGKMRRPPNLDEAEALGPGVTPVYADAAAGALDVRTPEGEKFSIDDPALLRRLAGGLGDRHRLSLLRSDRSMTDCRPISLFNTWTARRLSEEVGAAVDQRRFRANIYMDLAVGEGFAEERFVGCVLGIGSKAVIQVLERDPRCKMITLDPDTAQQNSDVIRCVSRKHDGKAGLYAAVLTEGMIRPGDDIKLMN
jgi:uncharacterized protein YcbX